MQKRIVKYFPTDAYVAMALLACLGATYFGHWYVRAACSAIAFYYGTNVGILMERYRDR